MKQRKPFGSRGIGDIAAIAEDGRVLERHAAKGNEHRRRWQPDHFCAVGCQNQRYGAVGYMRKGVVDMLFRRIERQNGDRTRALRHENRATCTQLSHRPLAATGDRRSEDVLPVAQCPIPDVRCLIQHA